MTDQITVREGIINDQRATIARLREALDKIEGSVNWLPIPDRAQHDSAFALGWAMARNQVNEIIRAALAAAREADHA